jgi:hypothetical protein
MAKDKQGNIVPFHNGGQKWIDGTVVKITLNFLNLLVNSLPFPFQGADLPMGRLSELFNVNHFIVSQVNPHVAPFLHHTESRKGKGGILSAILFLIKSELRHRVNQVGEIFFF